jgi:hypothetical protein
MRLTQQQRGFLAEAAKHEWVSPGMFVGATKNFGGGGNYSRAAITMNSAQKVLARLRDRGLLENRSPNPALFFLTDAGREALR